MLLVKSTKPLPTKWLHIKCQDHFFPKLDCTGPQKEHNLIERTALALQVVLGWIQQAQHLAIDIFLKGQPPITNCS